MKGKNLVVLVVVAVAFALLAYLTSARKQRSGSAAAELLGKPVLEALQDVEKLNSVSDIVFQTAGSTVRVARAEEKWVAPDRFNYPVDFGKVRDFLRTLSEMRVGQLVTASGDQLAQLELVAPGDGSADGTGTRVTLRNAAGAEIASLLVGKEHLRTPPAGTPPSPWAQGGYPDGRYVSAAGRACLVSETLSDIPARVHDWFGQDIVNVSAYDTQEIMITSSNGTALTLRRPEGGGDLKLDDLSDREEMDTTKVNSLANMLSYFTFSDIADPSLSDETMGFDKPVTYSARNRNGQVYTLTVGNKQEGFNDRYVRLTASYTPPPEAPEPPAVPDSAEAPDAEAKNAEAAKQAAEAKQKRLEEQAAFAEEVREFNAKTGTWTYLVPADKLTNLSANRADFVKEKAKPEEAKADSKEAKAEPAAE